MSIRGWMLLSWMMLWLLDDELLVDAKIVTSVNLIETSRVSLDYMLISYTWKTCHESHILVEG